MPAIAGRSLMPLLLAAFLAACAGGSEESSLPRHPGAISTDATAAINALLHSKAMPALAADSTLAGHRLARYETSGANAQGRRALGLLDFAHPDGRLLPLLYGIDYAVGPKGVTLERTRVAAWATPRPRLEVFVVPESRFVQHKLKDVSYGRMRQAVRAMAATTPAIAGKTEDHLIFVFVRDPVSSTARFEIKVANEAVGSGGYPVPAREVAFKDWRVIAAGGRFALGGPGVPLYLKVVYTPGDEAGFLDGYSRLVGTYVLSGTAR
jgi:hypothetical protein